MLREIIRDGLWGRWRSLIDTEAKTVGSAMRAIRLKRRMTTGAVARAMKMPVRTYEHLEHGTGRITYERILSFAEATESDAIAILTAPAFGGPDFAVRCADNKLMTINVFALLELNDELGEDVDLLEVNTLVGGFARLSKDLVAHVRNRPTAVEDWLRRGSSSRVPFTGRLRPVKT